MIIFIMKNISALLLLTFTSLSFACMENITKEKVTCNTNYSMEKLQTQFDELLNTEYFDELRDINIKLTSFKSDAYYLATGIKKLLRNKKKRHYNVRINEALFDCAPPERAMKAILAHELVHIKDYVNKNALKMIGFGVGYLVAPAKIERGTDYRVLKLGLVHGISDYRKWIYPKLSASDLKRKKKRYYTPTEIDRLIDDGTLYPID